MIHEKKIYSESFQRILEWSKKYELRLADWECSVWDTLVLQEWDPVTQKYTGRVIEKEVTHVRKTKDITLWPAEDIEKYGFQILSFE